MADPLAGIFGPDPLKAVFGGDSDFITGVQNKPTPLLDLSSEPAKPDILSDLFAAPQVHPSANDAAKAQQLNDQQNAQDYHDESWGQWAGQKVASAAAAIPSGIGSALGGTGDFLRRSYEVMKANGLEDMFPKDAMNPITDVGVTAQGLNSAAAPVQNYAQTIESAVPEGQQQQFGNKAAALFGGLTGLISSALVGGDVALIPQLIGQGFDQVDQVLREKGESGHSGAGLAAEAAGGTTVAALNMTGLGLLIHGLPLPIQNSIVRGLTGLGIRAGADAVTFAAQGIVTNLAGKLGVDPSTPVSKWGDVLQGAGENALMGGLMGAVFGAVSGRTPMRESGVEAPDNNVQPPVPSRSYSVEDAIRELGMPADEAQAKYGQSGVLPPLPLEQQHAIAQGTPLLTPEDHASPLPTDLIAQGKGTIAGDLPDITKAALPQVPPDVQAQIDQAFAAIKLPEMPVNAPQSAPDLGTPADTAQPEIAPQQPANGPQEAILQGLLARGIPETAAKAAAAGSMAEARADPTAVDSASGAVGIGQWLGSRKDHLIKRYGSEPTLDEQLDFLAYELKGGDSGGKAVLEAPDEQSALQAYITKFMRPAAGKETAGDLQRGDAALGVDLKVNAPETATAAALPAGDEFALDKMPPPEQPAEQPTQDDWQLFHPDSGTLGVERADLPQIESAHHGPLINFLGARDIGQKEETVDPATLKPTQAEFSPAKIETALGSTGDRAVLVSSDNHILDGTHQWLAALQSGEPLRVIRLDAPIHDLINLAHEFPSSQVSDETASSAPPALEQFKAPAQAVPLGDAKGGDVVDAAGAQFVRSFATRKSLELWAKNNNVDLKESLPVGGYFEGTSRYTMPEIDNGARIALVDHQPAVEAAQPPTAAPDGDALETETPQGPQAQSHAEPQPEPPQPKKRSGWASYDPTMPRNFMGVVADHLASLSKRSGIRTRLSAEDAIDQGVPADSIFIKANAKHPIVKLALTKVFATDKGPLRSTAQPTKLLSLDSLHDFSPERFGRAPDPEEHYTRLSQADAADLLRLSFEKHPDSFDRHDERYAKLQESLATAENDAIEHDHRSAIHDIASEAGWKIEPDEEDAALSHVARGETHAAAVWYAAREAGARLLEEAHRQTGRDKYGIAAHDIYQGEIAKQRDTGPETGVARSEAGQASANEGAAAREGAHEPVAADGQAHPAGQAAAPEQAQAVERPTYAVPDEVKEQAKKAYPNHPNTQQHFIRGYMAELGDENAKEKLVDSEAEKDGARYAQDNPTDLQPDMFGTRPEDQRRALEQQAEGRLQSDKEQRPPGSDGGLFDATHEQTGDMLGAGHNSENNIQPTDPVEKAKAILQQGLDALNGKEAQPEEAKPEPTPEERGMTPLFDEQNPQQQVGHIDEKTGKIELEKPREGGPTEALASAVDNPHAPFYSALEKSVDANPTKRASAEQWLATLKRAPGVKQDELDWSGVEDWLKMQKGPVDKEALLGVVRDGGIKVDEVVLGEPGFRNERSQYLYPAIEKALRGASSRDDAIMLLANDGEAYRVLQKNDPELFRPDSEDEDYYNEDWAANVVDDIFPEEFAAGPQFQSWSSDESNPSYRELLITLPLGEGGNPERAPATHWDQEAVVAHARFMDKTDADGKKVLFIEEVQSDWHQKGRDQGYEQKADHADADKAQVAWANAENSFREKAERLIAAYQAAGHEIPRDRQGSSMMDLRRAAGWVSDDRQWRESMSGKEQSELLHEYERSREEMDLRGRERDIALGLITSGGVPNAPFKATWPALVMKRMIRWAVDHGYDKIAWTTGSEQAERYSLDKHISRVVFTDNSSGGIGKASLEGETTHGTIRAYDSHSRLVLDQHIWSPEELDGIIGKELADKLLAAQPQQHREAGMGLRLRQIEGLDIKTGGEGMRAFYDRNLVNITNDIIKKYGEKVGPQKIQQTAGQLTATMRGQQRLAEIADGAEAVQTNPGFEINDKLREAATGGFPLFNVGGIKTRFSPEQHAQFAKELPAALKALGVEDRIALRLADSAALAHDSTQGQYWNRVATIAMDKAKDPYRVLVHEVGGHGLKSLGLYTKTEWNMLTGAAWADKEMRSWAERNYPGRPLEYQKEEAAAEWLAEQAAVRRNLEALAKKSFGARMAYRLVRFVMAVGRAARKVLGQPETAGDVAHKVFSGDIGARPTGFAEAPRDNPGFGAKGLLPDENGKRVQQQLEGPRGQASEEEEGRPATIADSHPERMFAPVRAVLDAISEGRSERIGKAIDNMRTVVQDRFLPVLRTQASIERMLGRKIGDDENPYLAEELFHGRTGSRLDNLMRDHVEPIFAQMREGKVKPDDLDAFLYARHAPERNERIAQINPTEFGSDLYGKRGSGSGMSDEDAASIMRGVDKSGKRAILESIAAKVDAMLSQAVDTRVESGLLSPEEAAAWRRTYQNYVPLRGLPGDEDTEGARINRASGFTVKGKESRMAFGRKSLAQDILAHSILQADEAIVRSEQNEVAKALGALAEAAPDPTFWKVDKIRRIPVLNKSTGLVSYRSESRIAADDAPYTVSYKDGGVEHRVTFNRREDSAVRTAAAMRNLNMQQMNFIVRTIGTINRLLSKMYTSYVPEFIISNGFRDLQSAAFFVPAQNIKGLTKKVALDYPAALVTATKGSFGKESNTEWGRWHREFRLEGGHTAFNDMRNVADLRKEVEHASTLKGPLSPKKMAQAIIHVVENTNDGVENALRLATYKNARELGVSKKQAASLAKNVTVNFNRKGTMGPLLNTLYLFFNASIQDDARIIMLLGKSRKVQAMAAGMVALGYAMQLINTARSQKDKDGDLYYNKINEYDHERNLIIMLDGQHYIKIPMQWGLNSFPNFGRMLARMYQGERPMKALADFTNATLDSFSPVGSGSLIETMAPTVTRPIVDLSTNTDYAGRPIMPDQKRAGEAIPNSQRYWSSVPPYDKAVTDFLNKASGGDEVRPGAIDVSPEVLHYLSNQIFGGVGTFFANLASIGTKALANDPSNVIETNEIPFSRRVYGSKPGWYDRAAFIARIQEVQQDVTYAKTYVKQGNIEKAREMVGTSDDRQLLQLAAAAQAAQDGMNQLHSIRGQLENAQAAGKISDTQFKADKLKLEQQEAHIVDAFNSIYLRDVSKPLRP